jgi:hypothetical protein
VLFFRPRKKRTARAARPARHLNTSCLVSKF